MATVLSGPLRENASEEDLTVDVHIRECLEALKKRGLKWEDFFNGLAAVYLRETRLEEAIERKDSGGDTARIYRRYAQLMRHLSEEIGWYSHAHGNSVEVRETWRMIERTRSQGLADYYVFQNLPLFITSEEYQDIFRSVANAEWMIKYCGWCVSYATDR